MLEREAKREKNLESRAREIERQRDQLERDKAREVQEKKDGKDDKMEEILRKVDADCEFLFVFILFFIFFFLSISALLRFYVVCFVVLANPDIFHSALFLYFSVFFPFAQSLP